MDSEDIEFLQEAAAALDMTDEEFSVFVGEVEERALEEEREEEGEEFYRLAGPWDDWMDADVWYEVSGLYGEM